MKKITVLVCALACFCAFFAGCGKNETPAATTAAAQPFTEAAAVTEAPTEAPTEATTEAATEAAVAAPALEDGVYSAEFNTDSGMFHVNEAMEGKGTLTVQDGKMTLHVTLASKGILNLFVGKAEDAVKDGAVILEHTEDPVTYKDGFSETVYGFDIPVAVIGEDFDLALIGKKGVWYDHVVSVTNPEKIG